MRNVNYLFLSLIVPSLLFAEVSRTLSERESGTQLCLKHQFSISTCLTFPFADKLSPDNLKLAKRISEFVNLGTFEEIEAENLIGDDSDSQKWVKLITSGVYSREVVSEQIAIALAVLFSPLSEPEIENARALKEAGFSWRISLGAAKNGMLTLQQIALASECRGKGVLELNQEINCIEGAKIGAMDLDNFPLFFEF